MALEIFRQYTAVHDGKKLLCVNFVDLQLLKKSEKLMPILQEIITDHEMSYERVRINYRKTQGRIVNCL